MNRRWIFFGTMLIIGGLILVLISQIPAEEKWEIVRSAPAYSTYKLNSRFQKGEVFAVVVIPNNDWFYLPDGGGYFSFFVSLNNSEGAVACFNITLELEVRPGTFLPQIYVVRLRIDPLNFSSTALDLYRPQDLFGRWRGDPAIPVVVKKDDIYTAIVDFDPNFSKRLREFFGPPEKLELWKLVEQSPPYLWTLHPGVALTITGLVATGLGVKYKRKIV